MRSDFDCYINITSDEIILFVHRSSGLPRSDNLIQIPTTGAEFSDAASMIYPELKWGFNIWLNHKGPLSSDRYLVNIKRSVLRAWDVKHNRWGAPEEE